MEEKSKPESETKETTKESSPKPAPKAPTVSYLPARLLARPPPPPPPSTSPTSTKAPSTKAPCTHLPSYILRPSAPPSYISRPSAPPSPSKRLSPTPLPPKLHIPLSQPPRLIPFPNQHKRCCSAPLPPASPAYGGLRWSSDDEKVVAFKMEGIREDGDGKEDTPLSAFVHWLSLFSHEYVIPPAFQRFL